MELQKPPDVVEDAALDQELAEVVSEQPETSEVERVQPSRRPLVVKFLRGAGAVGALAAVGVGSVGVVKYEYDIHHTVPNHVVTLPDSQVTNILTSPAEVLPTPTDTSVAPAPTPTPEAISPIIPNLPPAAPERLIVPKLGIDTSIDPVDSADTGQKNSWGGEIYEKINFPVDADARYWVRQGEPNTLTDDQDINNPQVVARTIIYGHASDIGNNLLFQNLEALQLGDTFTLVAGGYSYTYTVYELSNPAKDGLADDGDVYGLPADGRKEAALIACLPDSASHSVRIGYLTLVQPVS